MTTRWFIGLAVLALVQTSAWAAAARQPVVDEKARRIEIPSRVAKQNVYEQLKGAVEYVAVCVGGKEYEAMFICLVDAKDLHEAMLRIGLKPGTPAQEKDGQELPPRGDAMRIEVTWEEGGNTQRLGVEEFVLDEMAKGPMQPVNWVFTGSRQAEHPDTRQMMLEATATGNLISLHQLDPTVLIQNSAPDASQSGRYKANPKRLPKEGTPVVLVLQAIRADRLHVRISGQVQGVGFRDFVRRTALALGLRGWVRNLADGQVELVAEGEPQTLEQFRQKIAKGPRGSRVEQVQDVNPPNNEPLGAFETRPTP